MANAARVLRNEADVRTKVVDVWLREHGFTASDISVERGSCSDLAEVSIGFLEVPHRIK